MRGPPPQEYGHQGGMAPYGAAAAGAGAGMVAGSMMGHHYDQHHQQGPPDYNNNPYPPQDPYAQQHPYAPQNPYEIDSQTQYGAYQAPIHEHPPQPQFNDAAVPYRGPASPITRTDGTTSPRAEIQRDPATLGFSGRRPSHSPARSAASVPPPAEDAPPVPPVRQDLPIGAAVEMDAASGSPARSPAVGEHGFPMPDRGNTGSPAVVSPLNAPMSSSANSFPLPDHTTQTSG